MFRLRDGFVPSTTDGGGSGLGAQARPVDGEASATREKTRSIGDDPCQVPETTMFLTGPANPTPATNNANRFRYRRKKSSNLGGYWIFLSFFQVKLNRYPKPKTAFGEDLN